MEDLILNNGQKAKFLYVNQWNKRVYQLENGTKVCDNNPNPNGIGDLHTISAEYEEPEFPLDDEFQPIN